MLWLALHFPQLLISSLDGNKAQPVATVIVASTGSQRLVHQCDALARNAGIDYGLLINTAYALQPELRVVEYCGQQQEILNTLALWAMQN